MQKSKQTQLGYRSWLQHNDTIVFTGSNAIEPSNRPFVEGWDD